MACGKTHLMLFCRQEQWRLESKSVDSSINEIKLFQKKTKNNKAKMILRYIMLIFRSSLFYIFPSKKCERHQVWVIMSIFVSVDLQDLFDQIVLLMPFYDFA